MFNVLSFRCTALHLYWILTHGIYGEHKHVRTLERTGGGGNIVDLIFNRVLSDISLSLLSTLRSLLYIGGAHMSDESLILSLNWAAKFATAYYSCIKMGYAGETNAQIYLFFVNWNYGIKDLVGDLQLLLFHNIVIHQYPQFNKCKPRHNNSFSFTFFCGKITDIQHFRRKMASSFMPDYISVSSIESHYSIFTILSWRPWCPLTLFCHL